MFGDGKDADVNKLEALCNENGMSLRALTENQGNNLIDILMEYQNVQDIPEEDIIPEGQEDIETELGDEVEPF